MEKKTNQKPKYFKKQKWKRAPGGGGIHAIIRNGLVFDSVGVNFSEVYGKFDKKFRSQIPGTNKKS